MQPARIVPIVFAYDTTPESRRHASKTATPHLQGAWMPITADCKALAGFSWSSLCDGMAGWFARWNHHLDALSTGPPPSNLDARWFSMRGLPTTEHSDERQQLLSDREQPRPLARASQLAPPHRRRQHSQPKMLNRLYAKWGNRNARAANPRRPGIAPASCYIKLPFSILVWGAGYGAAQHTRIKPRTGPALSRSGTPSTPARCNWLSGKPPPQSLAASNRHALPPAHTQSRKPRPA